MNAYVNTSHYVCSRRMVDAQWACNYLKANWFKIVRDPSQADLIVLVTCAYSKDARDDSVVCIRKLLRHKNSGSRIIIGGCLPAIDPKVIENLGITDTFGPRSFYKLDDILHSQISISDIARPNDMHSINIPYSPFLKVINSIKDNFSIQLLASVIKALSKRMGSLTGMFLFIPMIKKIISVVCSLYELHQASACAFRFHISDGCLGKCSYCVIRKATGRLKSVPLDEIINSFKVGLKKGYSIFYVISEDVGAYGQDLGINIADLMEAIFKIEGDYKIYIENFGILWMIKYFPRLKKILKDNCDRIGIISFPVESGSNRILALMKRNYNIEDAKRCFFQLREEVPSLKIATHIMIGFPGETREDFKKTLELVGSVKFEVLFVFSYHGFHSSASNLLPDKVPENIKKRRHVELIARLFTTF